MSERRSMIGIRIRPEAERKIRALADRYEMSVSAVARGMMEHGFRPWLDAMKAERSS